MSNTEKVTTKEVHLCSVDLPARWEQMELGNFIQQLQNIRLANPGMLTIGFDYSEWGASCEITLHREKTPQELSLEAAQEVARLEYVRSIEKAQYLALKEKYGEEK